MKLTDTVSGAYVRITRFDSVNAFVRRRLSDLCIAEGSVVTLLQTLPFRGPCVIGAEGQSVAIRRSDADNIEVEAV